MNKDATTKRISTHFAATNVLKGAAVGLLAAVWLAEYWLQDNTNIPVISVYVNLLKLM